jgi:uncharacterized Zn-binding protein involved in type VI secretion
MPGISVCNVDTAGGTILPGPNAIVYYKGNPLAVVGCPVAPHDTHDRAVMETGSTKVFIGGIAVCMAGSRASCGHTATGRPDLTTSS